MLATVPRFFAVVLSTDELLRSHVAPLDWLGKLLRPGMMRERRMVGSAITLCANSFFGKLGDGKNCLEIGLQSENMRLSL
jgi:hypothetical protein